MERSEGQNIFQMMVDASSNETPHWRHRWPVIVTRNGWSNGVAEIIASEPAFSEWDRSKTPYFGNPKVFMLVKYRAGDAYQLEELASPGTFAYTRLSEQPSWWRQEIRYPVTGRYKGRKLFLAPDGSFSIDAQR